MHYDPNFQPGLRLHDLAARLCAEGRNEDAIVTAIGACELEPDRHEPWTMLSGVYDTIKGRGLEKFQAEAARRAIAIDPNDALAWHNLSTAQMRLYQWEESLFSANRAHRLMPENPYCLLQAASLLNQMSRLEESLVFLDGAIALFRNSPMDDGSVTAQKFYRDVYSARSISKLELGDWSGYFEDYRKRLEYGLETPETIKDIEVHRVEWFKSGKLWKPGAPVGQSVAVELENGIGDELQYSRLLIPFVAANPQIRHLRVFCRDQVRNLIPTFRTLQGSNIPFRQEAFDTFIAGMDLAEWAYLRGEEPFGKWTDPYLRPPAKIATDKEPGKNAVGFCWQGNPKHGYDWARSFPLTTFLEWAEPRRKSCTFHSIQYGEKQFQFPDWIKEASPKDFTEQCAVMRGLDIIVGPDTGILHAAGGLGIPTVMIETFKGDPRWKIGTIYDPQTFRIVKQTKPGDWESAFAQLGPAMDKALDTVEQREMVEAMTA